MNEVWRYVEDDGASASSGLATDELLLSRPTPTLRLYTYASHCALVGKFQNLEAEIDTDFCRERGIAMNRRPTGGGAILMGEDQLGIAVIHSSLTPGAPEHPKEIFALFGDAILRGLARFGIRGSLEAKNDIRVDGRKIAGLGVCRNDAGAFLFHTSLIVDLDVDLMLRVLRIPAEKRTDKLRARVEDNLTTVRRELGRPIGTGEVREAIREGFAERLGASFVARPLDEDERAGARRLEETVYRSEAWVFRRVPHPDANGASVRKTPEGLLRLYLSLAGERIKDVTITGDFVATGDGVLAVEKALTSIVATEDTIRDAIGSASVAVPLALGGISESDLTAAILEAVAEARRHSSASGPYGCFVNPAESARA